MDLFDYQAQKVSDASKPLADRMRPKNLTAFIGQTHVMGQGSLIQRAIERDRIFSMILWGPPGCGKTTLARIIASETRSHFTHFSAVLSGVKEIRAVIEMAIDLTQIRELQSQLTSIGLLVGSISHGIKGLLTGLDGGIYMVNSGFERDKPERVEKGWAMVQRNVDRIRSMVLDILYYAKDRELSLSDIEVDPLMGEIKEGLESGAIEYIVKPFAPEDLTNQVKDILQRVGVSE